MTPVADNAPSKNVTATFSAATDLGQIRERNEDLFLLQDLARTDHMEGGAPAQIDLEKGRGLLAVFDGMGGAASGDVAARIARDSVSRQLCGDAEDLEKAVVQSLVVANREVRSRAAVERRYAGMGTTATVAALQQNVLVIGHVGDSRAYLLRRGQLYQLTEDQSLINELVSSGVVSDEAASQSPLSNVILQALGVCQEVVPFVGTIELRFDDRLLLCSDGLSNMLEKEEMLEILSGESDVGKATKQLVQQANHAGGHDNITVVVAHFTGDGLDRDSADLPLGVELRPVQAPDLAQLSPPQNTGEFWALIIGALLVISAVVGVILFLGR